MVPTIGRIVHYQLSADDAMQINRRRTDSHSIRDRLQQEATNGVKAWPAGAQAHIGNDAREGQEFPMIITKIWGSGENPGVNGQAFLDGNDVLWVTSAECGDYPGGYQWPVRS